MRTNLVAEKQTKSVADYMQMVPRPKVLSRTRTHARVDSSAAVGRKIRMNLFRIPPRYPQSRRPLFVESSVSCLSRQLCLHTNTCREPSGLATQRVSESSEKQNVLTRSLPTQLGAEDACTWCVTVSAFCCTV